MYAYDVHCSLMYSLSEWNVKLAVQSALCLRGVLNK